MLLKLNRKQLRLVAGLLTGQCHIKGHSFKPGLTDSSRWERWLENEGSAIHSLFDSDATAYLRFRHMGHYFVGPSDYHGAPIRKVLYFFKSVRLTEG
jgi:hypothetical protein